MRVAWGVVVVVLSLLCWGGQTLARFAPATAVKLTLIEPEDTVEPTYWADIRAEALWDFFTLWTLLVAGALLLFDVAAWAYFGLVGGGMYLYFAGRGISAAQRCNVVGFGSGRPRTSRRPTRSCRSGVALQS